MALPTIGAKTPERLMLPDVRRLDRMPSLPAWVALRVRSMNDEWQKSSTDGKYRMTPTLPANLILNQAERLEIERHVSELDELCAQTPTNGANWEGATLVLVTELMLTLPSSQQNEAGVEATGKAFQAALDDVPTWAVAVGIRRWHRCECGENERGQPYDYHWRPAPAELRRIALVAIREVKERAHILRKLLVAEPLVEFSDEHCAQMRARLAALIPRTSRSI
jgi:hypothetical protein